MGVVNKQGAAELLRAWLPVAISMATACWWIFHYFVPYHEFIVETAWADVRMSRVRVEVYASMVNATVEPGQRAQLQKRLDAAVAEQEELTRMARTLGNR